MYYEPIAGYPDSKKHIEMYLGPAIDVGSAMIYKILKENGGNVCRLTVSPWRQEEEAKHFLQMDRVQFMASVHEALGPGCTISDFAEDEPTPEFDYCANKDQDSFEENPGEILPPTYA